ncbi:glycoside hydrolase family 95 protein [Paenibacillus sp. LHD-117]|uniref:glycoside hydrolase family 95 protein n=1 Tax=Paenibacillus sp. LHD-117 TaxID=3071412 RepID=UPI0027DF1661|nr:glycoside hydrolase family 95 protein [Paenibacillus sp. LHD-117]MDQ6418124.1 glycoside hydrolase family 95 protein [Paenibacillus sp. LHD-117]
MTNDKLWYQTPAQEWVQALPLGNGHMGAMAYGGKDGLFDLSEVTCWSGAPQEKYLNDDAAALMREARLALLAGDITKAELLMEGCNGLKQNYGSQVPFGRLWVGVSREPHGQRRELDLRTGMARDDLFYDDLAIVRESIISNPDKVMMVRMSAKGSLMPDVRVWMEGWSQPSNTTRQGSLLLVRGRALENIHSDGLHGVSYYGRLQLVTDGQIESSKQGVLVKNATEMVAYLTIMTDMFTDDMKGRCAERAQSAVNKGWDKLLQAHTNEHVQWMDRCMLNLPASEASKLPTDLRLKKYKEDKSDYALVALFFQYGRYLLLGSSRPDSLLPAALQGAWNDNRACRMEWTDDMHLDINTQMNYFPAETTGLGDCVLPLFTWMEQALVPQGTRIARELYECEGWVAHTVSNAYGWAAPGWGGCSWGFHVSGGAWVATHLWEHYLYTGDDKFLQRAYPILRGAAQFLHNILLPHPETGELLVTPSYSPENKYAIRGEEHHISAGAAVDTILARQIFNIVIEADRLLNREDALIRDLKESLEKLPPLRIGKHGQLMEWYEDFDEPLPDHRHTSHLLSLYPFGVINPDDTPELAQAAAVSVKRRLGENATDIVFANWAGALLVLYSARLLEGEAAERFLDSMMSILSRDNMMITHDGPTSSLTGGIYELDGNTGLTSGVVEMLLQSYRNELHILPSIPSSWSEGSFQGLMGQGGHRVSVDWECHSPTSITIEAGCDGEIQLRYKNSVVSFPYRKNESRRFRYEQEQLVLN